MDTHLHQSEGSLSESAPKATTQDWHDLTDMISSGNRTGVQSLLTGTDFMSETKRPIAINSPLWYAINYGHLNIFKDLCSYGFLTHEADAQGQNTLHWVAKFGKNEILKFIHENEDISFERPDDTGATPLMLACSGKHLNTVKLILDSGGLINGRYPPEFSSALHKAVDGGNIDICRLLCERGANLNQIDSYNETPLHIAVENGNREIIPFLVDAGCRINNSTSSNIVSPIFSALNNGEYDAVRLLHHLGADFNVLSQNGQSPLQVALLHKDFRMLLILVELNAIFCPPTFSPFQTAYTSDETKFPRLLFDAGVYTNKCLVSCLSSGNENINHELKSLLVTPRSLCQLAVFKIRSVHGTNIKAMSTTLKIPETLKLYLLLRFD